MPATADELQALNIIRAAQGRPSLTAAEVEALAYAPAPGVTAPPPPSAEEQQALAYLRAQRPEASASSLVPPLPDAGRIVGGALDTARTIRGAVPAMTDAGAPVVDAVALAAGGYSGALTAAETELLAQVGRERQAAGDAPLTTQEATAIVLKRRWRADPAPSRPCPA